MPQILLPEASAIVNFNFSKICNNENHKPNFNSNSGRIKSSIPRKYYKKKSSRFKKFDWMDILESENTRKTLKIEKSKSKPCRRMVAAARRAETPP